VSSEESPDSQTNRFRQTRGLVVLARAACHSGGRGVQEMHEADRAGSSQAGQTNTAVGLLPLPGFAARLATDLGNLPGARRPQRVTHRNETC